MWDLDKFLISIHVIKIAWPLYTVGEHTNGANVERERERERERESLNNTFKNSFYFISHEKWHK